MIHEELSGKIIGAGMMPEPYPCYPFNPWFF